MDTELLKIVAQAAGIGGIALGVLLLIFREVIRKNLFPNLSREQGYRLIRLVVSLTFAIAVFGIGAWVWVQKSSGPDKATSPAAATGGSVTQSINGGTGVIQTGPGQITITNTEGVPPAPAKLAPASKERAPHTGVAP